MDSTDLRQRIVLRGGGFAGVYTAMRLDRDSPAILPSRSSWSAVTHRRRKANEGGAAGGKAGAAGWDSSG